MRELTARDRAAARSATLSGRTSLLVEPDRFDEVMGASRAGHRVGQQHPGDEYRQTDVSTTDRPWPVAVGRLGHLTHWLLASGPQREA